MYNYNKYRPPSEETQGEKLYAGQIGLSESSPLRSDGYGTVRQGRLDNVISG
jgi:hypothetical protein